MKARLLLWLVLLALPVQAKMEHNRFVFSDWQIASNAVILLPTPPRRPAQLTHKDLGARMVCRTTTGRLIDEGIITWDFLQAAFESDMSFFCSNSGALVHYPE